MGKHKKHSTKYWTYYRRKQMSKKVKDRWDKGQMRCRRKPRTLWERIIYCIKGGSNGLQ